jgi:RNA polymerase sigma-70 factor (ECF subfamily)
MELASSSAARRAVLDAEARAAAAGDRVAFERFYRATVARVATLARRLLGRERCEEAVQEVYLRAWRGLPSWRGEAGAATWLERLARNTLIHLVEKRAPLGTSEGDALAERAAPAPLGELGLDLEAAIARLPRGARMVFVLHDVEGLAHEEIARALGVTVGTTKSQLHRARMLLRAALEPERSGGRS